MSMFSGMCWCWGYQDSMEMGGKSGEFESIFVFDNWSLFFVVVAGV